MCPLLKSAILETLGSLKELGIRAVGCSEHTENELYDIDMTYPLTLYAEDKGSGGSTAKLVTIWPRSPCVAT